MALETPVLFLLCDPFYNFRVRIEYRTLITLRMIPSVLALITLYPRLPITIIYCMLVSVGVNLIAKFTELILTEELITEIAKIVILIWFIRQLNLIKMLLVLWTTFIETKYFVHLRVGHFSRFNPLFALFDLLDEFLFGLRLTFGLLRGLLR